MTSTKSFSYGYVRYVTTSVDNRRINKSTKKFVPDGLDPLIITHLLPKL